MIENPPVNLKYNYAYFQIFNLYSSGNAGPIALCIHTLRAKIVIATIQRQCICFFVLETSKRPIIFVTGNSMKPGPPGNKNRSVGYSLHPPAAEATENMNPRHGMVERPRTSRLSFT